MSNRQEQNSGTRPVREAHRIDESRLFEYLGDQISGFEGPLTVSQFKGGQSNPTYKLETPKHSYVLRRKPPGKLLPSAHAVDREYRVISALHETGFPVARPHLLCEDDDVIGTMFYVMDCVDGPIYWEPDLPQCDTESRAEIYDSMNRTIARLHSIDFKAIGLEDYGKAGNYFERQISRWSKQYIASETETIEPMNKLMAWLEGNVPSDQSESIVHGDYRLDNMVFNPTANSVAAILDWELSTIGHPLADFTYHLMAWQMPDIGIGSSGLVGKDVSELGIPTEQAYVEAYCERTGRDGIENRDFYSAFNFFRIAAILQGIAGRVRDGTAASAHAANAIAGVGPLAETGWHYAQQAGAAG
ncbi:MAG: phosphotransferase family protein [Pseudomonadota bacterium]